MLSARRVAWLIAVLVFIPLAAGGSNAAPTAAAPEPSLSAITALARTANLSARFYAASRDSASRVSATVASRYSNWVWQVVPAKNRLVLLYGSPVGLGLIGALDDNQLISRVRAQAATYQQLDPAHPAIPGLDFVTPVAQPFPMGDGSWTSRVSDALIQRYLSLAVANHFLFFFDMQLGLSTVTRELDQLAPYLRDPEVGLALDPEFDMHAGGTPGRQFGQMSANEINQAIDRLASVVDTFDLPPKYLIVHQFLDSMLPDRSSIKLRPEVSVILCVDGFGPPGSKIDDYERFDNPPIQLPGFKLFYQQDHPLMSEAQVIALQPPPLLVMYQ
jgi:hypothetical protein